MSVENFIEFWRDKGGAESRMAQRYLAAREDFESSHREMLKCLRPKASGKMTLLVLRDADAVVARFEGAEKILNDVAHDIEQFEELAGNHTLDMLARERQRLKRALDNAVYATKTATLRQIRNNRAKSAEEAVTTAEVLDCAAKRDRIAEDLGPKLKDIETRIKQARAILAKY
ncbi:MAG: hypothetical protein A4E48_02757 [Methanosaeta sp. PtaU1.Bin060]|nr:MAG: hypothetical protein A4E48_02757 [Methanosaeta sp. PtaU1.Bin060]